MINPRYQDNGKTKRIKVDVWFWFFEAQTRMVVFVVLIICVVCRFPPMTLA